MTRSRHDDASAREAKELFRRAVAALDEGARRRPAADRARRLKESAGLAVEAFRAARGAGDMNEVIVDRATDETLAALRSLNDNEQYPAGELDGPERRYRAALPALRAALARELPGYEGARGLARRAARNAWTRASLGIVIAAAAATIAAHRLADPAHVLELGGQVFWKSSAEERFSEQRSRRFPVTVDGAVHEYALDFDEPARVAVLRLDPVDSAAPTDIDILDVALLGPGGDPRVEFAFDGDTPWSCVNCRWIALDGGARLQPGNDDPYIVAPPMAPVEVGGMRIRMRASAKKTLWEWITRMEKNH